MKGSWAILLLVFTAMIFGYQNCGSPGVEFETLGQKSLDESLVTGSGQGTDEGSEEAVDPLVPAKEEPSSSEIDSQIDTRPGQEPVQFAGCKSYVEIQNLDEVVVPARDGEGTCFYISLMEAVDNHKSGTMNEPFASDVFARPHSKPEAEPYVLADVEIISLTLEGERKVALSSKFDDPSAEMFIDNFFLLEQLTAAGMQRKWAYGTKDSIPLDGPILVGDYEVKEFFDFAPGGTAKVSAIDMSAAIPKGLRMNLRFRGLDCGGGAQASDVFLVFH